MATFLFYAAGGLAILSVIWFVVRGPNSTSLELLFLAVIVAIIGLIAQGLLG